MQGFAASTSLYSQRPRNQSHAGQYLQAVPVQSLDSNQSPICKLSLVDSAKTAFSNKVFVAEVAGGKLQFMVLIHMTVKGVLPCMSCSCRTSARALCSAAQSLLMNSKIAQLHLPNHSIRVWFHARLTSSLKLLLGPGAQWNT